MSEDTTLNWPMDGSKPEVGATIRMRCPDCRAGETMLVSLVSAQVVEGITVCDSGHRWRIARLQDDEQLVPKESYGVHRTR